MSRLLTPLLLLLLLSTASAQWTNDSVLAGGYRRTFHYERSAAIAQPKIVLFILHGSGGSGAEMRTHTAALESIAVRESILLVYPDGYKHFWNECRKASTAEANIIDIDEQDFFRAMLRSLHAQFGTDTTVARAIGFSGGGHMAYKLALTMPQIFTAVTAVVANLPDSANMDCTAANLPVSVMIVNGTADNVNPYNGGEVKVQNVKLGTVRSTEQTFRYWSALAGYAGAPKKEILPNNDTTDNSSIERFSFSAPGKKEIVLLSVLNGTHSFPKDIDVFLEAWSFMKRQPLR